MNCDSCNGIIESGEEYVATLIQREKVGRFGRIKVVETEAACIYHTYCINSRDTNVNFLAMLEQTTVK